jgi:hypothetical protein
MPAPLLGRGSGHPTHVVGPALIIRHALLRYNPDRPQGFDVDSD